MNENNDSTIQVTLKYGGAKGGRLIYGTTKHIVQKAKISVRKVLRSSYYGLTPLMRQFLYQKTVCTDDGWPLPRGVQS